MLSSPSLSFSAVLLSILRVDALTRDLHIVNAQISPDGFTRDAVLAEGTMPGPLLSGNKGDEFKINVVNELTDNNGMLLSTSIHWHGLFQHGTNWADGPAFVNQCPIATNHSFLYDFKVPNQAGTFWYHSHLSTQYCDGLRGAIAIYDPLDPLKLQYDVDDSTTIITLADWYHTPSLIAGAAGVPTPDSTLINGLGRYVNGPASPLAVINVIQGKRYRFRLVNIACDPNFNFTIDGHTLTVIEADGVETEPLVVDMIQIYAAQRYSFILTANQTVDNYWIRANPDVGQAGFDGGINSAILRYQGAPVADPTTTQTPSINPLLEQNLHTQTALGLGTVPGGQGPGQVDVAINLDVEFGLTSFLFTVNGVTFEPPTVPVLLQILSGAQSASSLMPTGSVYTLPLNKVIEVSIPGGVVGGGHPVHLHGHTFWVVRSASSTEYNYDNPVQRDVVNIGTTGDNVTIRFETNNPGPWFLHCHIDWHLNLGFAIVFAEDTQDTAAQNPVPAAWSQLCPIYDALPADQL